VKASACFLCGRCPRSTLPETRVGTTIGVPCCTHTPAARWGQAPWAPPSRGIAMWYLCIDEITLAARVQRRARLYRPLVPCEDKRPIERSVKANFRLHAPAKSFGETSVGAGESRCTRYGRRGVVPRPIGSVHQLNHSQQQHFMWKEGALQLLGGSEQTQTAHGNATPVSRHALFNYPNTGWPCRALLHLLDKHALVLYHIQTLSAWMSLQWVTWWSLVLRLLFQAQHSHVPIWVFNLPLFHCKTLRSIPTKTHIPTWDAPKLEPRHRYFVTLTREKEQRGPQREPSRDGSGVATAPIRQGAIS